MSVKSFKRFNDEYDFEDAQQHRKPKRVRRQDKRSGKQLPCERED